MLLPTDSGLDQAVTGLAHSIGRPGNPELESVGLNNTAHFDFVALSVTLTREPPIPLGISGARP